MYFKTSEEKHIQRIVQQLEKLYKGQPIGSVRIGSEYGMSYHRVLVYLHKAKDAGLVTPVFSNAGGIIRGWVPAHANVTLTVAEQNAVRAADAVKVLANGSPVSGGAVGRHIKVTQPTALRWLKLAQRMKLVRYSSSPKGWKPV